MDQQEAKRRGLDELIDLRKETKQLQSEVAVLRRALEDNLERWDVYQAPDYNQEFGMVYQSIDKLERRVSDMEQSRLIASPDELVAEVRQISTQKMTDQVDAVKRVATNANNAVTEMSRVVASARERHQQSFWVSCAFLAGFFVCMLLATVVFPMLKKI